MKWILTVSEDKFRRNLEKSVAPATFATRFSVGESSGFVGGRKGENKWFFYYRRKGVFPLFSCTMTVKRCREEGGKQLSLSFSRGLGATLLGSFWCFLMLFTGVLLVGAEPLFSLWFLIPGGGCAIPLFCFFPSTKKRLLNLVEEAGAIPDNKKEIG